MGELEQAAFKAMADFISDSCKALLKSGVSLVKDHFNEACVELEIGFKRYLEEQYRRFSKVKTLVNRDRPISIDRIYVSTTICIEKREVSEKYLLKLIEECRLIIFTGIAGSGKSMLLKKNFIKMLKKPIGSIPIFVELRNIDGSLEQGLFAYIFQLFGPPTSRLTEAQLTHGFTIGKFTLFLDGLDEVAPEHRASITKQIIEMSQRFRALKVVCSSRPDEYRFGSWSEFHIAELRPLNEKEVQLLIKKMPFETNAKGRFSRAVETSIYKSHRNFLSNPLLCTMMLLTYDELLEIPEKMHIFYAHAFDVLFSKHDRTKPIAYKRRFHTDLASDDFKRTFSTFCALSYGNKKVAMTEKDASDYSEASLRFEGKTANSKDFLLDLLESVCVLIRDGIFITFLHRSFQEYFTAIFLSERQLSSLSLLIEDAALRTQDSTVGLLYEINRGALEQKYLKPKLQELLLLVKDEGFDVKLADFFRLFYVGISLQLESKRPSLIVSTADLHGTEKGRFQPLLRICEAHYFEGGARWFQGDEFDWLEWADRHRPISSQEIHGDRISFKNPNENILSETPFWDMLRQLLKDFELLSKRLSSEENMQISVLSDTIPKLLSGPC